MFKKADSSAQVMIISVAIGVILIIGFYIMSKNMGDNFAGVSGKASSALSDATAKLQTS